MSHYTSTPTTAQHSVGHSHKFSTQVVRVVQDNVNGSHFITYMDGGNISSLFGLFFPIAQESNSGLGRNIVEVSSVLATHSAVSFPPS
jgi:hypothetical protein